MIYLFIDVMSSVVKTSVGLKCTACILQYHQKLKKIQYRINYEKYKLKKTELILAQNSEHVFLKGRSLNQTR